MGKYDSEIIEILGKEPSEEESKLLEIVLDIAFEYIMRKFKLSRKEISIFSVGLASKTYDLWYIEWQNLETGKCYELKLKVLTKNK